MSLASRISDVLSWFHFRASRSLSISDASFSVGAISDASFSVGAQTLSPFDWRPVTAAAHPCTSPWHWALPSVAASESRSTRSTFGLESQASPLCRLTSFFSLSEAARSGAAARGVVAHISRRPLTSFEMDPPENAEEAAKPLLQKQIEQAALYGTQSSYGVARLLSYADDVRRDLDALRDYAAKALRSATLASVNPARRWIPDAPGTCTAVEAQQMCSRESLRELYAGKVRQLKQRHERRENAWTAAYSRNFSNASLGVRAGRLAAKFGHAAGRVKNTATGHAKRVTEAGHAAGLSATGHAKDLIGSHFGVGK